MPKSLVLTHRSQNEMENISVYCLFSGDFKVFLLFNTVFQIFIIEHLVIIFPNYKQLKQVPLKLLMQPMFVIVLFFSYCSDMNLNENNKITMWFGKSPDSYIWKMLFGGWFFNSKVLKRYMWNIMLWKLIDWYKIEWHFLEGHSPKKKEGIFHSVYSPQTD